MATGLKDCAGGDRRSIGDAGRVVGSSDFPAADGDGRSGEIVKLDEFVSGAVRAAHAKLADDYIAGNCLNPGRETQEKHESENREYHDGGRSEHTGLPC